MSALGVTADVVGILSFALTIVLLIRSESLRNEIESQRSEYQKGQKSIKVNMMALRDNVWEDQVLSLKIISEIRTQLYSFEHKFGRLLTRRDKRHLYVTLQMLDASVDSIDRGHLCRELDYFIARFERRELN